jgi:hypothetical protein
MGTEHFIQDPASPQYHLISSGGFTLRLNPDALRTLEALVREGVAVLPRRGLEVGGLLLGDNGSDLRLEAVHPITIEYQFGPSYQLSDSDIELIQQSISNLSCQFSLRVLGHFRSHTKGELEITDADRTIAELTGASEPLILLIRGDLTKPSLARLYRGFTEGSAELLEFPLVPTVSRPAIPSGEAPSEQTALGSPDGDIARNPGEGVAPVSQLRQDSAYGVWWKTLSATDLITSAAFAVTGLLACVALVFYFASPSPSPPGTDVKKPLGLSVRQADGQLVVRWDPSSPGVRDGISGVLTVHDGAAQHEVRLSPNELASAIVGYAPQTSIVEFRLVVYRDRLRHTDESVTVVAAATEPIPERTAADRTPHGLVAEKKSPTNKAKMSLSSPPRPQPHDPPPEMKTAETLEPSATATATPPPVQLSESRPEIPTALLAAQAPVAPRIPNPSPNPAPSRLDAAPPEVAPSTISYVAPIPVRKTSPSVPANLRPMFRDGVTIEVKVAIDAQGEVISAIPVNLSSSNRKLLSPIAVQAALLWRFEPARRNGQPVGSETILKFNFEPRAR